MEVEEYSLKDLLSRIVDNRGRTCPTAETGTALIATNCIKDDQLYPVFENVRWVDQETMESWFRGHPEPGDILFVLKGSPGRCCLVPDPINFCIAQDMLALRADESKVSQKFLFALLRSSIVRNAIDNLHVGTMIPHFKKGDFDKLRFQIPKSREIQEWIGDQYFILSDKIELNRRMNATLEGMAQALFKSWFVDFDPVIDNALAAGNPIPDELAPRAEVRKSALANGTTQQGSADHPTLSDPKSLFPASFEFSDEIGPIPQGWNARKLSELATVTKGKSYKSSELQSSTTALVTLKSFTRGGGYRLDGLKEYTGNYKPEQVVESGDLIISYTDVTQAADVIGKPAMVIPDERYETLVISLDVGVVRPNGPTLKHFLYQLARTKRFEDWMLSHTSGTTVLHLSKNAFPSFECAFPDEELISEFENIVSPLFKRTVQNVKESRALIRLRDALLPKLISGELRITEAEQLTEEALT